MTSVKIKLEVLEVCLACVAGASIAAGTVAFCLHPEEVHRVLTEMGLQEFAQQLMNREEQPAAAEQPEHTAYTLNIENSYNAAVQKTGELVFRPQRAQSFVNSCACADICCSEPLTLSFEPGDHTDHKALAVTIIAYDTDGSEKTLLREYELTDQAIEITIPETEGHTTILVHAKNYQSIQQSETNREVTCRII